MSIQNLSPHGESQPPLQQVWTMALQHGVKPQVAVATGVIMALRSMVEATDLLVLPPANLVSFMNVHLLIHLNKNICS